MSNISRVSLFAKLNPIAFKSVEGATVLCKLRGNPYVQLTHWVAQILHQDDSDWHHILRPFEVDAGLLLADVQRALEEDVATGDLTAALKRLGLWREAGAEP